MLAKRRMGSARWLAEDTPPGLANHFWRWKMAHNGKLKLSDYPDFDKLFSWEKEKIKKAVDKRWRREKRITRKLLTGKDE